MNKLSKMLLVVISLSASFLAGSALSNSPYKKCVLLSKKAEGFQIEMTRPLKTNKLYLLKYKGRVTKTVGEDQKTIYKFELVEE